MEPQKSNASPPPIPSTVPRPKPAWMTNQRDSAWDRVKDAFQRDWEQTKSDFSATSGLDLNQSSADTVKQALGTQPVPAITEKSRPDTDEHVARQHSRLSKVQEKATEVIEVKSQDILAQKARLSVKTEQANLLAATHKVESNREAATALERSAERAGAARRDRDATDAEVQSEVDAAHNDASKAMEDAAAQRVQYDAHADATIVTAQALADRKIRSDEEAVARAAAARDAATRRWLEVEPAARYGFMARTTMPNSPRYWNATVEANLRAEWNAMNPGTPWEQSMPHVRRGWEYVDESEPYSTDEVTSPDRTLPR